MRSNTLTRVSNNPGAVQIYSRGSISNSVPITSRLGVRIQNIHNQLT